MKWDIQTTFSYNYYWRVILKITDIEIAPKNYNQIPFKYKIFIQIIELFFYSLKTYVGGFFVTSVCLKLIFLFI
ncbi:hypothetical protein BpHYR1_032740 [Brachionus plicatilis]|uniref:Uncharacterized protein n=1 Tax=Brachionus plicatilis TaxID=10195 RepID=A0A3M7T3K7_BRAPC|nr:hypothetical protein BpHYR1_032740 [Brachionus plicatilis]